MNQRFPGNQAPAPTLSPYAALRQRQNLLEKREALSRLLKGELAQAGYDKTGMMTNRLANDLQLADDSTIQEFDPRSFRAYVREQQRFDPMSRVYAASRAMREPASSSSTPSPWTAAPTYDWTDDLLPSAGTGADPFAIRSSLSLGAAARGRGW